MPLELLQVGVVALNLSVAGLVQPRVPGQHVPLEPEASLVIEIYRGKRPRRGRFSRFRVRYMETKPGKVRRDRVLRLQHLSPHEAYGFAGEHMMVMAT